MKLRALFIGGAMVASASLATAQLNSSYYEATPTFVETFAGGASVGQWELDPSNLAGAGAPTFITSTPAGIAAAYAAANPVGSSVDGGVMMMGNASSTAGTLFGLNYVRCVNSLSAGGGTDFTALTEYRVVVSLYLPTVAMLGGGDPRFQVGPYAYAGDLFRASSWYNSGTPGTGPGFAFRGMIESSAFLSNSAVSAGDWYEFEIMVANSTVPNQARAAIGFDVDNDGTIEEGEVTEFRTDLNIDTGVKPANTFGIFTVGLVSNDIYPLFVDTVSLYLPAVASTSDWELYQ